MRGSTCALFAMLVLLVLKLASAPFVIVVVALAAAAADCYDTMYDRRDHETVKTWPIRIGEITVVRTHRTFTFMVMMVCSGNKMMTVAFFYECLE